jgi:uncharacterized RDD family membrane protein YckC
VSDIPVGSPPVPPGRHAAPGGWYADPVDPTRERYWDGWQWSRNTRPREVTRFTPPPAAGGPPPGYPAQAGYPVQPMYPSYRAATTADGVRLAGWWWRALAVLIDSVITSVVVIAVAFPIWQPMYAAFTAYFEAILEAQQSGGPPPPAFDPTGLFSLRDQVLFTAVSLAIGMLYQMAFLRWKGATPGKLICRLRVVPVDRGRDPGPLSWTAVVLRSAIWVLPGINSLLALFTVVDVLFPLWHPKRQALHDLAARTQVARPGPETGWPTSKNLR